MRSLNVLTLGLVVWLAVLEPAAAQTVAPTMVPVPNQVGVSAAVRGAVELSRAGVVGRNVKSGEPIFLGDEISTDASGGLQIILLDETVFTIGPNSAIVIDEFVYDPATNAGKIGATAVKGVFRFISGKIAHKDPNAMKVKLPAGLIGIRGTMVAGRVEGQQSLVVLLGPGDQNNTGDQPGQIAVSNQVGLDTRQVMVTRPGYGTSITGPNVPPTPPALIPQAQLDALTQDLATPAKAKQAKSSDEAGDQEQAAAPAPGEASATELAGQETFGILEEVVELVAIAEIAEDLGDETDKSAQDAADASATVADGIASFDQIRTVETGQFHFEVNDPNGFTQTTDGGSPITGTLPTGKLKFQINVDFGARTVGGGNSIVTAETSTNTSGATGISSFIEASEHSQLAIPAKAFGSGPSNAVFKFTNVGNKQLDVKLTLKNADGTIGKTADVTVDHDAGEPSGDRGSGTKTDVVRTVGLEAGPTP